MVSVDVRHHVYLTLVFGILPPTIAKTVTPYVSENWFLMFEVRNMKGRFKKRCSEFRDGPKLQALVCDILPPTIAIVDYAIGLEKMSANEPFFDDVQTAVRL